MKIAVAADHAGYEFKERLKGYLKDNGYEVRDFGADSPESSDYPDYAIPAIKSVRDGECDRGILICGNGLGMCITANRFPGIRAGMVYSERTAEQTRKHHDSNILCLGAREFPAGELLKFADIWLNTDFEAGRHARRIGKIEDLHPE